MNWLRRSDAARCAGRKVTDTERLDWIEKRHTLHDDLEIWYVVDGYRLYVRTNDGGKHLGEFEGLSIRSCIDQAMEKFP